MQGNAINDPGFAWAPYESSRARPWNLALAAHLLRRAGFGASWPQLQQALADGPQRSVDTLFHPSGDLDGFERRVSAMSAAVAISDAAGSDECAGLWLYRMSATPNPLLEKMTLFWHNFFAISGSAMGKTSLVEQHVRMLRRNALGRFDVLVSEVSRDPGAGIALNPRGSRNAKNTDAFTADLLGSKALVVRKLYRFLIAETEEPSEVLLAPLVGSFAKDLDIAKLVSVILRSNLFFSAAAYRQRIKSPLEFALGFAAAFEMSIAAAPLHRQLTDLGQKLLEPPTRAGWAGGRRWLNRFTLIGRGNLISAMLGRWQAESAGHRGKVRTAWPRGDREVSVGYCSCRMTRRRTPELCPPASSCRQS